MIPCKRGLWGRHKMCRLFLSLSSILFMLSFVFFFIHLQALLVLHFQFLYNFFSIVCFFILPFPSFSVSYPSSPFSVSLHLILPLNFLFPIHFVPLLMFSFRLYQSPDSHGCALRDLVISRHRLCSSGYHSSILGTSRVQTSAWKSATLTETVFYPSPSR